MKTRGTPEAIKIDNIQDLKKISSLMEARIKVRANSAVFTEPFESSSAFELGRGNRLAISRVDATSKNIRGRSESFGLIQPNFLRSSDELPKDRGKRIRSNPSPLAKDISRIERFITSSVLLCPERTKRIIIRIVAK